MVELLALFTWIWFIHLVIDVALGGPIVLLGWCLHLYASSPLASTGSPPAGRNDLRTKQRRNRDAFMTTTVLRITALTLSVSVAGCSMAPAISMTAKQRGSDVDFEFGTRGINGLLEFRVWRADTRELLWDVDLNYYGGARLTYGDIPKDFTTTNGNQQSATQIFPADEAKPKKLPASGKVLVEVECQYDDFAAACSRRFDFAVTTGSDGRVLTTVPIDDLPTTDRPQRK
jgi:hypothetical protein